MSSMNSQRGFSLLEVVVTLGLFAFVIVALLGFFPIAQRSTADASALTEAPLIAESIFSLLQISGPQGMIAIGPDWLNSPSQCSSFSLRETSHHYVAYSYQGKPQHALTLREYEAPLQQQGITSAVGITVMPDKQLPGMIHVDIDMSTPAHLSIKQRYHSRLTFYYFPNPTET